MKNRDAELKLIVNVLANQSRVYKCSYQQAWEQYVHPSVKQLASFDEVVGYAITSVLEQKRRAA